MKLILILPNSPEWDYMWNWLENHPINASLSEPTTALNENEAWQYMGSFKQGERVIHEFRHRNHPLTNTRQDLKLEASKNLTQDQIQKEFNL